MAPVNAILPSSPRVLKFVEVQIYNVDVPSLLYTGVVTNLISADLVDHLNLVPEASRKSITVADGSNSSFVGRLRNLRITSGHLTIHFDFVIVQNASHGLIICITYLENMRAVIDGAGQIVDVKLGEESVSLSMQPETGKPFAKEETSRELFTSNTNANDGDISSALTGDDSYSGDEHYLFVALAKDSSDSEEAGTDEAAVLAAQLAHLLDAARKVIND